jgi:hypothetical protein
LVLLTFLFLSVFFGLKFYFEKRNVQIQLARNYWENAGKARDEGRHLYSFHLWAEAVAVNPDPAFRKILLFDMNDYWNCLPLQHIFQHEGSVSKAKFNADETRILTYGHDGTARLWDIGVDYDYPIDKIKLQVWALTGTKFNTTTMEIEFIDPDEWRKIKKEYMEFAVEHYKTCKYPHANVFRKLFPEEAKELKRTVIGHWSLVVARGHDCMDAWGYGVLGKTKMNC